MKQSTLIAWGLFLLLGLPGGWGLLSSVAQEEPDPERLFGAVWTNTDFSKHSVSFSEIRSGGVTRDGIPPYYPTGYRYPEHIAGELGGSTPRYTVEYLSIAETDEYLPDAQQVIAVEIEGEARAYPLLLLNNHEIVNTQIHDLPVAVTFCPLCNAAIVFERRTDRYPRLTFGVSGLLRNSDLIMWDHETESWWQQFTGEAIVGALTGERLRMIPSLVVSWGEFKARYPQGLVLANQAQRQPGQVSYAGYDVGGVPFLFSGEVDERLFPTTRVLGYFGAEGAIAYPLSRLAEVKVVNDRIAGEPVVVIWQAGAESLFSAGLQTGSAGLFRAVLRDGRPLNFRAVEDGVMDVETGSTWNVFGQAVQGELAGTVLEPYLAHPHFWFAWAAFRPDTLIWEPGMIADEAWAAHQP